MVHLGAPDLTDDGRRGRARDERERVGRDPHTEGLRGGHLVRAGRRPVPHRQADADREVIGDRRVVLRPTARQVVLHVDRLDRTGGGCELLEQLVGDQDVVEVGRPVREAPVGAAALRDGEVGEAVVPRSVEEALEDVVRRLVGEQVIEVAGDDHPLVREVRVHVGLEQVARRHPAELLVAGIGQVEEPVAAALEVVVDHDDLLAVEGQLHHDGRARKGAPVRRGRVDLVHRLHLHRRRVVDVGQPGEPGRLVEGLVARKRVHDVLQVVGVVDLLQGEHVRIERLDHVPDSVDRELTVLREPLDVPGHHVEGLLRPEGEVGERLGRRVHAEGGHRQEDQGRRGRAVVLSGTEQGGGVHGRGSRVRSRRRRAGDVRGWRPARGRGRATGDRARSTRDRGGAKRGRRDRRVHPSESSVTCRKGSRRARTRRRTARSKPRVSAGFEALAQGPWRYTGPSAPDHALTALQSASHGPA